MIPRLLLMGACWLTVALSLAYIGWVGVVLFVMRPVDAWILAIPVASIVGWLLLMVYGR